MDLRVGLGNIGPTDTICIHISTFYLTVDNIEETLFDGKYFFKKYNRLLPDGYRCKGLWIKYLVRQMVVGFVLQKDVVCSNSGVG